MKELTTWTTEWSSSLYALEVQKKINLSDERCVEKVGSGPGFTGNISHVWIKEEKCPEGPGRVRRGRAAHMFHFVWNQPEYNCGPPLIFSSSLSHSEKCPVYMGITYLFTNRLTSRVMRSGQLKEKNILGIIELGHILGHDIELLRFIQVTWAPTLRYGSSRKRKIIIYWS